MGFSRTHTIPEGDPEFAPRHNVSFFVFWESLLSSDFRCSKLKFENERELLGFLSGDLVDFNTIELQVHICFPFFFFKLSSKESRDKDIIRNQPKCV